MAFSLAQYQHYLASAGYERREVPFIERADLFSTKGGDRVIEHLLTFEYGNSEYALRPEFTASAARAYSKSERSFARWQFSGPVFEDRAGNGDHAFQRESLGAELIGVAGPLADSEIIGVAASGLIQQGIVDFQIVIGHAGLTRKLIERFTSDTQIIQFLLNQRGTLGDPNQGLSEARAALEKFLSLREPGTLTAGQFETEGLSQLLASVTLRTTTLGGRTRDEIARRLLRKQRRTEESHLLLRAVDTLETWVTLKGPPGAVFPQVYQLAEDSHVFAAVVADLRTTLDLLEGYGISANMITLQPDLNRVWEYYSGIVFEFQTPEGESIGGGGRYDGLPRLLGNPEDVPAVGFQINIDSIRKRTGSPASERCDLALVGGRSHALSVIQWASMLRANGVVCEIWETLPEGAWRVVNIDSHGAHFDDRSFDASQLHALLAYLGELKAE